MTDTDGFKTRMIDKVINTGKDYLNDIAGNLIKDKEMADYTKQIVNGTAESLNQMHKARVTDQSLASTKNTSDSGLAEKPKTFWQKVGGFFKGIWNKFRDPIQGLIGKIPVVGGLANKVINHFSPKDQIQMKGPGGVMPDAIKPGPKPQLIDL